MLPSMAEEKNVAAAPLCDQGKRFMARIFLELLDIFELFRGVPRYASRDSVFLSSAIFFAKDEIGIPHRRCR